MCCAGIDKLQVFKEALELHRDKLHLTEQQVILLHELEADKHKNFPIIYCITPTYWRYVQKAELTRISQTLQLVPNIHWIVVEDAAEKSDLVRNLIEDSRLIATHLVAQTAPYEKVKDKVSQEFGCLDADGNLRVFWGRIRRPEDTGGWSSATPGFAGCGIIWWQAKTREWCTLWMMTIPIA